MMEFTLSFGQLITTVSILLAGAGFIFSTRQMAQQASRDLELHAAAENEKIEALRRALENLDRRNREDHAAILKACNGTKGVPPIAIGT